MTLYKIFKLIKESFIKTISSRKNKELITKDDTAFIPNGVYILHETLGVRTVNEWNTNDNGGVVGILVVYNEHKIVVATEDAPDNLRWSEKSRLINQPVEKLGDAKSDFNGEYYCQKLNFPDFSAAYYCNTYNKGGRNWYLPSSGELRLIYRHLGEIQKALLIVGGQQFLTTWDKDVPVYWSSTEYSAPYAWNLDLSSGGYGWYTKVNSSCKVRPISKIKI